jgi:hypothetical protein
MVSKVSSFIAKQSARLRNPRSMEDCLMVTLQYHGYWRKFLKCLQFSTQIQQCTISNIIPETSKVIYKSMKDKFLKVSKLLFILTEYNDPTNVLQHNKTLILKCHTLKTLKSTPTCFDQQLIIIRELICS